MNVVNVLTTHVPAPRNPAAKVARSFARPALQFAGLLGRACGSPRESELYRRITLTSSHEDHAARRRTDVPGGDRSGRRLDRPVLPPTWPWPVVSAPSVPANGFSNMQLELEPARARGRDAIASFDRDNRSFERDTDRIAELRRMQSPVSAMRSWRTSMREVGTGTSRALKHKADEVQATGAVDIVQQVL